MNPHMAQQANFTMMKRIRIEMRAADCHLFLTSEPAWVGAGNIHYDAFQMANRYAMKSKFLTLNTKYQRLPGQSAQEAQAAGNLNALFLNYPGLSSITQEGKPCVELQEIATLAGRLFDIYKPLRDGPF